jgi:hypothetical protein
MSGAILPLPQYAFMAWCLVKAQLCIINATTTERDGTNNPWMIVDGTGFKTENLTDSRRMRRRS